MGSEPGSWSWHTEWSPANPEQGHGWKTVRHRRRKRPVLVYEYPCLVTTAGGRTAGNKKGLKYNCCTKIMTIAAPIYILLALLLTLCAVINTDVSQRRTPRPRGAVQGHMATKGWERRPRNLKSRPPEPL